MRIQCRAAFKIWLALFVCIPAACSSTTVAPANTPTPAVTATLACEQTLILPQIVDIQPGLPRPGNEITVTGTGGLIRDTCGGYIEGLREFTLYLDGEPAGSISCYINRCEGKFTLPGTASAGTHCLLAGEDPLVKPAQCPFEFQVIQE